MKTLLLLAMLALTGCATTAPSNSYRAVGQVDAWQIGGTLNEMTGDIKITINGQPVISDSFGLTGSGGELSATYQGKTITAICGYSGSRFQCMILVNNERASTLIF